MSNSIFNKRMKEYEESYIQKLIPHIPIIIRLDGKSFHHYTKQGSRPYDSGLSEAFQRATVDLYKRIGGFDIAYGQSDEVSILIYNPNTRTQEYFDGKIFKLCSIIASMFTVDFNKHCYLSLTQDALFDCRVFQLPLHEVTNYFIWRQKDATRNSIQMLGQFHFSHKQLHGKSCNDIQDMLFKDENINWDKKPTINKRGWCVGREETPFGRLPKIDLEIPIFTQDREYIENHINKEIIDD